MANIHVLTRGDQVFNAVAHVAVPAGNNASNVPWSAALINSGIGGRTALPDGDGTAGTISAAEKASIAAGTLYEQPINLSPQPGANAAGFNAYLDAAFAAATADTQTRLQRVLQYFGATR